jgi:hypothetical protein
MTPVPARARLMLLECCQGAGWSVDERTTCTPDAGAISDDLRTDQLDGFVSIATDSGPACPLPAAPPDPGRVPLSEDLTSSACLTESGHRPTNDATIAGSDSGSDRERRHQAAMPKAAGTWPDRDAVNTEPWEILTPRRCQVVHGRPARPRRADQRVAHSETRGARGEAT